MFKKLKFRNDPAALERLSNAANAIEVFTDSHPNELSEEEHKELRSLLRERASALSDATGLKIHSICDDD